MRKPQLLPGPGTSQLSLRPLRPGEAVLFVKLLLPEGSPSVLYPLGPDSDQSTSARRASATSLHPGCREGQETSIFLLSLVRCGLRFWPRVFGWGIPQPRKRFNGNIHQPPHPASQQRQLWCRRTERMPRSHHHLLVAENSMSHFLPAHLCVKEAASKTEAEWSQSPGANGQWSVSLAALLGNNCLLDLITALFFNIYSSQQAKLRHLLFYGTSPESLSSQFPDLTLCNLTMLQY